MSGAERCDEIMRLIDEALEECEHVTQPRNPQQSDRISALDM